MTTRGFDKQWLLKYSGNMETVKVSKTEYESLKKKASLYEKVFQSVEKRMFGTELYSDKRVKDFLKEDGLDKEITEKLENLLRS